MTTKRLAAFGLILALALGAGSAAWGAQPGDRQGRARLRERVSDLYLLRMTRALELTEEQTAKLYPVLTRVEKEKSALQSDMGSDLRDLRTELAKTAPGEKEVLRLVDRIRQARRAVRERDEEVEAALDRVLTPVQKGRYIVFTVDFLRTVGEGMGRIWRGPGNY
jgi:Spy/CpxP family protein refolding chaperone